jgi:hypothetical protein
MPGGPELPIVEPLYVTSVVLVARWVMLESATNVEPATSAAGAALLSHALEVCNVRKAFNVPEVPALFTCKPGSPLADDEAHAK